MQNNFVEWKNNHKRIKNTQKVIIKHAITFLVLKLIQDTNILTYALVLADVLV